MHTNKNSVELELEAKSILTKDEYMKIISHLGLSTNKSVGQLNYFFDNDGLFLNENDITLRTRFKGGIRQLTLKENSAGGKLETNYTPLSDGELADLIIYGFVPAKSGVAVGIKRLGIQNTISYQGQMLTDRIEIPYIGCKLALDHSKYIGQEDYEIELERGEEKCDEKEVLKNFLSNLSIKYKEAKSKRKRFFEAKEAYAVKA
jgi:uncharacterized protein YjbK